MLCDADSTCQRIVGETAHKCLMVEFLRLQHAARRHAAAAACTQLTGAGSVARLVTPAVGAAALGSAAAPAPPGCGRILMSAQFLWHIDFRTLSERKAQKLPASFKPQKAP